MKILVLDNYDSFTYNLVHAVKKCMDKNTQLEVHRNDKISLDDVNRFDKIVLSPGPGVPSQAGIMPELIKRYAPTKSIFGVCLGLQAIAEAFDGSLINLENVYHGVATPITVLDSQEMLFSGLAKNFPAGRYHSWVVNRETLPECFKLTAVDEKGLIMSLTHKQYDVRGVQFHPESVLTDCGEKIICNWIRK